MGPIFSYQPLNAEELQFRLIDLLPGPGVIRCHLRTASLQDPEPYEALSYTWGAPRRKYQIFLNEKAFFVAYNLYTALHFLRGTRDGDRHWGASRTIWIDAICINQEDTSEKNYCVPLMREIYTSSQRTIIWLGKHNCLTRSALDGVEFLSSRSGDGGLKVNYYDWRRLRRCDKNRSEGFLGVVRAAIENVHAVAAFNSVFNRPWFTRLWVVQELALSRQAVFICGIHQIDWEHIAKAQSVSSNFILDNPGILELYQNFPDKMPHDILDHMFASWSKDAKILKDKIYGLLGFSASEGKEIPIQVDYDASDEEIFTNFTKSYLEHAGDLQILATSRGCQPRDPTTTSDAPSWVINYQNYKKTPGLFSWNSKCRHWRAGGHDPCKLVIDDKLLGVRGFVIDSAVQVSNVCKVGRERRGRSFVIGAISGWSSAIGFSKFYLEAKKLCHEVATTSIEEGTYNHTGQAIIEAFWQTLRAGNDPAVSIGGPMETPRDKKIRETVDKLLTRHAALVAALGDSIGSTILMMLYIVVLIMAGTGGGVSYVEFFAWCGWAKRRRFFVTEKGYIGLGPSETKVGDLVVLLQGGRVPIITRPGKPLGIVGESYIHGVMEGEAFDLEKCVELWYH